MEENVKNEETIKSVNKDKKKPSNKLIFKDEASLIGWFERIMIMVDKYGFRKIFQGAAFILIFFMMASTYNTCQSHNFIEEYMAREKQRHDEGLKLRSEIDPLVRQQLLKMLYSLNAERVFVIETHNGASNLSGLPFRFADMTYEEINNVTFSVSDEYSNISASRYSIFHYLSEHLFFVGTIDELMSIDNKMAYKMAANEAAYVGFKLINGVNEPLGIIGVTYSTRHDTLSINKNDVMNKLLFYSDKISILLDKAKVMENK